MRVEPIVHAIIWCMEPRAKCLTLDWALHGGWGNLLEDEHEVMEIWMGLKGVLAKRAPGVRIMEHIQ